MGSGGCDSDDALVDGLPAESRLLFIHQEPWQREIMSKYGEMVLLDATYRTTKYDVALFFLVVPTNVGYTVVAEFCLHSETSSDIAEALTLLKEWNPAWTPVHAMTDYSEAEMLAIQSVFPDCKVHLCDFHREQSWQR